MLALSQWPLQARRQIIGIFTDIDDTLTTHQAITPDALQALADLKAAGLAVIPITGRPVGWCAPHAQGDAAHGLQPWSVDAMVAENGGVAFVPEHNGQNSLQPLCSKRYKLSKIFAAATQRKAADGSNHRLAHAANLFPVAGDEVSLVHIGKTVGRHAANVGPGGKRFFATGDDHAGY